ncbi:MAG: hypothetical protein ABIQ09_19445 [Jatrophihabitantaceae bacterium]
MSNAKGRRARRHPDEHHLVQAVEASAALRQLLAAASAPPSQAELRGRSRAITDFRAAHRPGSTHPLPVNPAGGAVAQPGSPAASQPGLERRPPVRLAGVGRWSAARLTVACTALVALLGSTAVTAAAGELPTALQNAVSDLLNTPAPAGDSPAPAPSGSTAEPTVRPEPGRTGAPSSAPSRPASSPVKTDPPSMGPSSAHRSDARSPSTFPLPANRPHTDSPATTSLSTEQPNTVPLSTAQPDTAAPAAAPAAAARSVAASQASGWAHTRSQPRANRSTGRHG